MYLQARCAAAIEPSPWMCIHARLGLASYYRPSPQKKKKKTKGYYRPSLARGTGRHSQPFPGLPGTHTAAQKPFSSRKTKRRAAAHTTPVSGLQPVTEQGG
jgi:hypothetical protein